MLFRLFRLIVRTVLLPEIPLALRFVLFTYILMFHFRAFKGMIWSYGN